MTSTMLAATLALTLTCAALLHVLGLDPAWAVPLVLGSAGVALGLERWTRPQPAPVPLSATPVPIDFCFGCGQERPEDGHTCRLQPSRTALPRERSPLPRDFQGGGL